MTLNKITVINLVICILSLQTVNSRTSSVLWKLNGNVIYIPSEVKFSFLLKKKKKEENSK